MVPGSWHYIDCWHWATLAEASTYYSGQQQATAADVIVNTLGMSTLGLNKYPTVGHCWSMTYYFE